MRVDGLKAEAVPRCVPRAVVQTCLQEFFAIMAPTPSAVAREIQTHFALQSKRAAWSDLMLCCGLSRVGLSEEEWHEFLESAPKPGSLVMVSLRFAI